MDGAGQYGKQGVTITGYQVQWRSSQTSTALAGSWSQYPPPTDTKTKLTATQYKITGLYNDVMYDVQVQATNSVGGVSGWHPVTPAQGMPMEGAMTPTPALPFFGAVALGAGLVAAGRRRLRAQRQLKA